MKKVAFITQMAESGGTEISLINLLRSLSPQDVDVTLIILGGKGEIAKRIPDWVKIRVIKIKKLKDAFIQSIKAFDLLEAYSHSINIIKAKRDYYQKKGTFSQYYFGLSATEHIDEVFDIAITWALPNSMQTVYTLHHVSAKKKWLWIHMDVSMDIQPEDARDNFIKYDRIFCVSKACKQSFDRCFPECKSKTKVFYNVLNEDKIKLDALAHYEKLDGRFRIVTCGRLSEEKRPLMAIAVSKELIHNGYKDFRWYFIGAGKLKEHMGRAVKENHLDEYIRILGNKDNPFPYIAQANLYVQMSRHESYCMTLAEAQILGIPAVSTSFPSAYEIIENGYTGIIVEGDWRGVYNAIIAYLNNPNKSEQYKERMKGYRLKASSNGRHFIDLVNMS